MRVDGRMKCVGVSVHACCCASDASRTKRAMCMQADTGVPLPARPPTSLGATNTVDVGPFVGWTDWKATVRVAREED
eukprot:90441-Prorocentrum_minimum.AAC.3